MIPESDIDKIKNGYEILRIWGGMKTRCLNPKSSAFKDYGGRGIGICSGWLESKYQFLRDMGCRPSSTYSIERKNPNGGYWCGKCPDCVQNNRPLNCIWADKTDQANNRRSNRWLEVNGEIFTISQWAKRLGLSRNVIFGRLKHGLTPEECLNPLRKQDPELVRISKDNNLPYQMVKRRISRGWNTSDAATPPIAKNQVHQFNGESKTLRQWAACTGIPYQTLYTRIKNGWDNERIFLKI